MPLFPQAIALILLSFKISAIRLTVDVLPLVPVTQINFACDSFWIISISVVNLHPDEANFCNTWFVGGIPGLITA